MRYFSLLLVPMLFVQLGCSTPDSNEQEQEGIRSLYECVASDTEREPDSAIIKSGNAWNQGRAKFISVTLIDGEPHGVRCFDYTAMAPGNRKVAVTVTWSNDYLQPVELAMEAEPNGKYVVLAYELASNEKRADVNFGPREHSSADEMGKALAQGAIEGLAPLWFFPVLIYSLVSGTDEPATAPPFEGCCFIWIQELESSTVVAGEKP